MGTFTLPDGTSAFGVLRIAGEDSMLNLKSDHLLSDIQAGSSLLGVTFDRQRITCIDCLTQGTGQGRRRSEAIHYSAEIFPHFVTVGSQHLEPDTPTIKGIHFNVDDLPTLFFDFDAFGHVIDADSVIDAVLEGARRNRPIERGTMPIVAYFTGKVTIVKIDTVIGTVSVNHRPSFDSGGPSGVFIKNQMVVSIETETPMKFMDAIERMLTLGRFFSIAAGRKQGISNIHLTISGSDDEKIPQHLEVYWSHRWESVVHKGMPNRPHPGDVPLSPIGRADEFVQVIRDWLAREKTWRVPRIRYLNCLSKGSKYEVNRLVAAANMFDILPDDPTQAFGNLSQELAGAKDACISLLRAQPSGPDRDSALSALGRMGKPSLTKKINHRADIVLRQFGSSLSDLPVVVNTAVKCRNYFVHGSSDFDYLKVEHLTPFLTDALEFIFAASDLIDAGWNASNWSTQHHSNGHSFARFMSSYALSVAYLKRALS